MPHMNLYGNCMCINILHIFIYLTHEVMQSDDDDDDGRIGASIYTHLLYIYVHRGRGHTNFKEGWHGNV